MPLIVHWPAGIAADQAGIARDQFAPRRPTSCPPIYELLGVDAARRRTAGVEQMPVTGHVVRATSLADAAAPTPQHACSTSRWRAAGRIVRRRLEGGEQAPAGRRLRRRAVGAVPPRRRLVGVPRPRRRASPSRLAELVELWWSEAEATACCPLDDRTDRAVRRPVPRPHSPHPANRRYAYRPPMSPHARPGGRGASAGAAST